MLTDKMNRQTETKTRRSWQPVLTTYLPEPLDLFASTCVMSVDGVTFPVVDVNLLHAAQHQLPAHAHTLTSLSK